MLAALALFKERGYDATTVDEIAMAVGVSQRTFFRYFANKDDVVFLWVDAQGDFVGPRLRQRPHSETPYEATRHVLLALADWHDSQQNEIPFLVRLIFETPALGGRYKREHDRWVSEMINEVSRGRNLDTDALFDCTVQVAACVATFVAAIKTWATGERDDTVQSQVARAFSALESGVLTTTKSRGAGLPRRYADAESSEAHRPNRS